LNQVEEERRMIKNEVGKRGEDESGEEKEGVKVGRERNINSENQLSCDPHTKFTSLLALCYPQQNYLTAR
jgi:hypothetical protein